LVKFKADEILVVP